VKLLVVSFFGGLGGAERLLLDVASGLAEPPLLACPEGALSSDARDRGLGVFALPQRSLELRRSLRHRVAAPLAVASQAAALRALLTAERPEVLVAWGMRAGLVAAAARPRGACTPVVLQHHDLLPGPMIAGAVRGAARRADLVVTPSACVAADLDPRGTLASRMTVVAPGVDLERFRPGGKPSSEVLVLGAIERWKRPDFALEAFALAGRKLPDFRLRLVGAPVGAGGQELAAALRQRAERADLSGRVELAGALADPLPALHRAACLLHCAEREPYGMVVAEAMACGLPVVVPDSCGPAEIADRDCGRLYPPGDAPAAARALVEVLRDPTQTERMGAAARAAAERRLDGRRMCGSYGELFVRPHGAPPVRPHSAADRAERGKGLAVVTVLHNSEPELPALLCSLERRLPGAQVVIVDSASSDAGIEVARAWRGGRADVLALDENVGFGTAVNAGLARVQAPVTALLNPDVELADASLAAAAREAARGPERLIAPLVLRPDGAREDSAQLEPAGAAMLAHALIPGAALPASLAAAIEPWRSSRPRRAGWAVGSCIVARTQTLRRLGPFDERTFMYAEDLDLGMRAADAGVETWFWPAARVVHRGAHSTRRAFGGEPFDLLARRRREVVRERRGRARAWIDDGFQLLTFADRALLKRLARRAANRERRQFVALLRVPRGRRRT
jgi:N-acetylglucosaminyl-diphospho-decaprenol L-rhamnosyltransferase